MIQGVNRDWINPEVVKYFELEEFVDKIIQFLDDSNNIEEDIYINDEYVGEETIRHRTKKKCYNVTYKNENKYYKFEKLNPIINEILEEK